MMRRIVCIFGFILLGGPQVVHSQSKADLPSREEIKKLLVKAYDQANLWSEGAPPFHLAARTKSYGTKGTAIEGTYEFWWATKYHWREDVTWGSQLSLQVVDDNHLWRAGEDAHRADTFRVEKILKTWQGIYMDISKAAILMKQGNSSDSPTICLKGHRTDMPMQTICLDPKAGLLSETELGDQRWEYSEYASLSYERFPRRIRYMDGKNPLVDVNVELLELLDPTSSEAFVPPSGVASIDWCADMIGPKPIQYGGAPGDFQGAFAPPIPASYADLGMAVFTIDVHGHTSNVQAFLPGGPHIIDKSQKRMMMQTTFRPATCHGNPVPSEFVIWK